jgi:membrane-associated HD superfamily phosphohydrolase
VDVCGSNYEGMLATLYSKQRHLDVLVLITIFESKISCSSTFDSVSIQIPTGIIRLLYIFMVNHNFKASLSARCVSAANYICKETGIYNKIILCLLTLCVSLY